MTNIHHLRGEGPVKAGVFLTSREGYNRTKQAIGRPKVPRDIGMLEES